MVYIGEIKRDTPLWQDEEAAEMITTQNFLLVIAQIVVWAPGVNHKSNSQLGKQTFLFSKHRKILDSPLSLHCAALQT